MNRPRRHHHVPVFLLKRFCLSGPTTRVRVLRTDRVFETAPHNVGCERDFHTGVPIIADPERLLSVFEGKVAKATAAWTPGVLSESDQVLADQLVSHLRMRGRAIRGLGVRLVDNAARGADAIVHHSTQAVRPSTSIAEEVSRLTGEIYSAGLERADPAATSRLASHQLMDVLKRHLAFWAVAEGSEFVRAACRNGLSTEVVSGLHTSLILGGVLNHRARDGFGNCRWMVLSTDRPLLLGDVGPLARYQGSRRLRPLLLSEEAIRAVYLPIGSRRLLLGWRGRRPPAPAARTLNEATVALSREFVVGNLSRRALSALQARLGSRVDEEPAERVLGFPAPDIASAANEAVAAARSWAMRMVDRYWSGTPAGEASPSPAAAVMVEPTPMTRGGSRQRISTR